MLKRTVLRRSASPDKTRLVAVISAAVLILAGCQAPTSNDIVPTTTAELAVSTTLSVEPVTTPAATPTTTTTIPATTTTPPPAAAVVIDEVTTEDGWRYQVKVIPLNSDPNASPAGCVSIAPPGQTNLRFAVVVTNLIADRPAPSPQFVVSSNLIGDGSVVGDGPFSEETIRARVTQNVDEVVPVEPGTSCILASGPSEGDQIIEPGSEFPFEATFGPINETDVGSFRGAIRVFTTIGQAVEAEFGVDPGSGEFLGAKDLVSGDD